MLSTSNSLKILIISLLVMLPQTQADEIKQQIKNNSGNVVNTKTGDVTIITTKSIDKSTPQEKAYNGYKYWEKGDFKKAAELHLEAAKAGNRSAQYRLALQYQRGLYFQVNNTKAVFWHKKAAMQGSSGSMEELASIYENGGSGISKNLVKAYKWIILALQERTPSNGISELEKEEEITKNKKIDIEKKISKKQSKKANELVKHWLEEREKNQ